MVNHAGLDQFYSFDTTPLYRCNTNYLCLVHQNSASFESNLESFLISQRLKKREIKDTPDYETLLAWGKDKDITLGNAIPTDQARYNLL